MGKTILSVTIVITLLMGILVLLYTQNSPQTYTNIRQSSKMVKSANQEIFDYTAENDSLSIMLIADYGTGGEDQINTGLQLNIQAEKDQADFVLSFGDNFYDHGITKLGTQDPQWNAKWADIYQNQSYLKDLTWYGTIGNHDWGGEGLYAEFKYKAHGWRIDDFFWTHTATVQGKRIAFIHVDTSFLAYGAQGESSQPLMVEYFKKLGWTSNEQILALAEEQLQKYADYDWKIVMGHHAIGYSCGPTENTDLFYRLFQKYKVDVYLSGHTHTLSYSQHGGMGFLLSGAGGKADTKDWCLASLPRWSKANILGYMNIKINSDIMEVTAYYTQKGQETWETHSLPSFVRRGAN